jgi:magnesium-transporting ATPase (P-type)
LGKGWQQPYDLGLLDLRMPGMEGLAGAEAERRLQEYGPSVVARETRHSYLRLLGNALINPLVILLFVLAASSFLTGGIGAGIVVLIMVFISVVLRSSVNQPIGRTRCAFSPITPLATLCGGTRAFGYAPGM